MSINIPGIDTNKAITNCGSLETFTELLRDVYHLIDEKSNLVETYIKENDIKNYTILVHSLKTTCRTMGAAELGEQFFTLEKLGKENRQEEIMKLTPKVLNSFRALKPYLKPFVQNDNISQKDIDKKEIINHLQNLLTAMDDFDLTTAEEATQQLLNYHSTEELSPKFKSLHRLVSNLDYDEAKELSTEIIDSLKN